MILRDIIINIDKSSANSDYDEMARYHTINGINYRCDLDVTMTEVFPKQKTITIYE